MCEFPQCPEDAVGLGDRCALHEHVLINASYLTDAEIQDE